MSSCSAFSLKLSTIFIIYIHLLCQITCQYTTIWYDDMTNNAGWSVRSSHTEFDFASGGCKSGTCCVTNGGNGDDEWALRSTDISSYSYIRLHIHISTYRLYADSTCNIYYSYSSSSSASKILIKQIDPPDDTTGSSRYWYPDTVIDFPYSPSSNTIWIWLYSNSPSSTDYMWCVWDDVYLQAMPNTAQPTPLPTVKPSKSPTESPSESPSKSPIHSPSQSPTNQPIKATIESPTESPLQTQSPIKSLTPSTTKRSTQSPTNVPIYTDTSTNDSTTESEEERDADERVAIFSISSMIIISVIVSVVIIICCALVFRLYCLRRKETDVGDMMSAPGSVSTGVARMQSDRPPGTSTCQNVTKEPGESHARHETLSMPDLPDTIPETATLGQEQNAMNIVHENDNGYAFETPQDPNTSQCVDCLEVTEGIIFDEDGQFYCNECFLSYQ
eukprot:303142_1